MATSTDVLEFMDDAAALKEAWNNHRQDDQSSREALVGATSKLVASIHYISVAQTAAAVTLQIVRSIHRGDIRRR
jgi:hypothetical protein